MIRERATATGRVCASATGGGLYRPAGTVIGSLMLPTFCAGVTASLMHRPNSSTFSPRLIETRIGKPRFIAREDELPTVVFTWWNLLDAVMAAADVNARYQTGYLREFQARHMLKLARLPGMRTYCEIGECGASGLQRTQPPHTYHPPTPSPSED